MKLNTYTGYITALLIGILLMVAPGVTSGLVVVIIGLIVAAGGVAALIAEFKSPVRSQGALVFGAIRALLGLYIMTHTGTVLSIFPVLLGIYMLADGISGITGGNGNGTIMSVVLMIVGAILLFNPLRMLHSAISWCGVLMIVYAAMGLFRTGRYDGRW